MLEAKTRLSQLVDATERGEEVFIARHGNPVAQIVPLRRRKFRFGFLKDKVTPIPDALLFSMEEEEADKFIDGDL